MCAWINISALRYKESYIHVIAYVTGPARASVASYVTEHHYMCSAGESERLFGVFDATNAPVGSVLIGHAASEVCSSSLLQLHGGCLVDDTAN